MRTPPRLWVRPHAHWPWLLPCAAYAGLAAVLVYLLTLSPFALFWHTERFMLEHTSDAERRGFSMYLAYFLHYTLFVPHVQGVLIYSCLLCVVAGATRDCSHRTWNFCLGCFFAAVFAPIYTFLAARGMFWTWDVYTLFALGVVAVVATGIEYVCICLVRDRLLRRRREQDGRRCPRCGYDVSGQQARRCPECGTPLTEQELESTAAVGRQVRYALLLTGVLTTLPALAYVTFPFLIVPSWLRAARIGDHEYSTTPNLTYLLDLNPWIANYAIARQLSSPNVDVRRAAADFGRYRQYLCVGPAGAATNDDQRIPIKISDGVRDCLFRAARQDPDPLVRSNAAHALIAIADSAWTWAHFCELWSVWTPADRDSAVSGLRRYLLWHNDQASLNRLQELIDRHEPTGALP